MKHLGHYIIPQIFTNSILDYHARDVILNVNMSPFKDDIREEFGDLDVLFTYIEFKYGSYTLTLEDSLHEIYYLKWNTNGKYLGLFKN